MPELGPHLGQTNDNDRAIGLWRLRCQVKELLLYPVGCRATLSRKMPQSKTEDLSDSNGECVRSSQA